MQPVVSPRQEGRSEPAGGRARRGIACGLAAVLALVGCNAQVGAIDGKPSFRDQTAPIGVTSRFDEARFAGPWRVRAMIPGDEVVDRVSLSDGPSGLKMDVVAFVCDPAGICGNFPDTFPLRREGNGKYVSRLPGEGERRMWVLWVDEGFRTAVLGNPEGTFAWILDRKASGGTDRIRAAREILDFNGYDISQLKVMR